MLRKNKWWRSMIEKHGSEEKVRELMRERGNRSERNSKGTGGFAYLAKTNPDYLKEITSKGGKSKKH